MEVDRYETVAKLHKYHILYISCNVYSKLLGIYRTLTCILVVSFINDMLL